MGLRVRVRVRVKANRLSHELGPLGAQLDHAQQVVARHARLVRVRIGMRVGVRFGVRVRG